MTIDLTTEDLMVAATKAAVRQVMAIRKRRIGHDHGAHSKRKMAQRIGDSVIGNLGEMALSQAIGRPITSKFEDLRAKDIDQSLEVRTTEYANGCLLLHKSSPDDAIYVLVIVNDLSARVCGWIKADDGKRPEYWREGDPGCYFVPQSRLNPIDDLPLHLGAGETP